MNRLFLKINLILKLLKDIWNFFSFLDLSYNVPFNDKYKEFIDEYKEDLLNNKKRNIAANAIKKLFETNKAPLSDDYISELIEHDDDSKPCLNLLTPPLKKLGEKKYIRKNT